VGRTNRKLIKPSRSKQLQERTNYCRCLAIGAAEPKFTATLQALANEYEGEAERVEAQMETAATLRESAEVRTAHPELAG